MLEITKTLTGLNWEGKERNFTNVILSGGYETVDIIHISIELDEQIYCLSSTGVTIDNYYPTDSTDLVNSIFG